MGEIAQKVVVQNDPPNDYPVGEYSKSVVFDKMSVRRVVNPHQKNRTLESEVLFFWCRGRDSNSHDLAVAGS